MANKLSRALLPYLPAEPPPNSSRPQIQGSVRGLVLGVGEREHPSPPPLGVPRPFFWLCKCSPLHLPAQPWAQVREPSRKQSLILCLRLSKAQKHSRSTVGEGGYLHFSVPSSQDPGQSKPMCRGLRTTVLLCPILRVNSRHFPKTLKAGDSGLLGT